MAIDATLTAAINVAKAEMQAALTLEEAGFIMEDNLKRISFNAERCGWNGDDLSYAYGCLQQVYNLWQSPMIAENDKSQVITFQAGNLPDQNANQVTVPASGDPSFFKEGVVAVDQTYGDQFVKSELARLNKQPSALGKVMVAAGFFTMAAGAFFLLQNLIWGGSSRAW